MWIERFSFRGPLFWLCDALFLTLIHCLAVNWTNSHDLVLVCKPSVGKEKRRNDEFFTRLCFGHNISKSHWFLKEQRHEDFAVLGQFCAKIIILWGFNDKQNASVKPRRYQMHVIRIEISWGFLERVASKIEKNWPILSSFNPFPSMPTVATGDRKQFQYTVK